MKDKQDTKANSKQCVAAGQEEARPTPSDEPIEEKAEINKLLDEGCSVNQIIALGFKRRTAYHYAKLRIQPENDPAGSSQGEGPSGINVNAIAPGYTATEASLGQSGSEKTFEKVIASQCLKRREELTDVVPPSSSPCP
jgi:NAD(P)-dependent dehydrogenase (short-subunit alcohol dehydrogenase family)